MVLLVHDGDGREVLVHDGDGSGVVRFGRPMPGTGPCLLTAYSQS